MILILLARIYYLCQQHHVVATGASSEEPAHAQARPVGHLLDEGLVVVVPDCGQELVSFVLALPVGDYGVLGGDEVLEVPPIRAHGILAQLDLIAWLHLHLSHHVGESRPGQDLAHREGELQHLWAGQRELERPLLASSGPDGDQGLHCDVVSVSQAALDILHVLEKPYLPCLGRKGAHPPEIKIIKCFIRIQQSLSRYFRVREFIISFPKKRKLNGLKNKIKNLEFSRVKLKLNVCVSNLKINE